MSIARHHAEWLSLVPVSGPFLSLPVLLEAFPQGLDAHDAEHARLLIQKYSRTQDLSSYVAGSRWKASPDTRMTDLLHGTGVRLGLVTNGEHWMLVDAPKGETTGYASWYASLSREEKITLQAFRSLLSMARFFGVADDQAIEALLTKSASNQQEVTDQLGLQPKQR